MVDFVTKGDNMKKFLKAFFSTSNEINENIVMGVLFALVLLAAVFLPIVSGDKFYILAGMVAVFFGIAPFKK